MGSGNTLVDYSRAPCLGAEQKARGSGIEIVIRFARISPENAQSDRKSVNRRLPELDLPRGRDSWCWPKRMRPLGTKMFVKWKWAVSFTSSRAPCDTTASRQKRWRAYNCMEYLYRGFSKRGNGVVNTTLAYSPERRGGRNEPIESFLFRSWSISMHKSK